MSRSGITSAGDWETRLAAVAVNQDWIPQLSVYLELLERFQDALDLVAPGDAGTLLYEHVLEALAGADHLVGTGLLVDAGSGAGLPGVPLLIACPRWRGTLLEPRERRWAFLREVVRELRLDCEVRRQRIEEAAGTFEALVVRALAMRVWAGPAARLVRPGGRVLWWTAEEAPPAPAGFEPVVTSPLPVRQRGRVVVLTRRST